MSDIGAFIAGCSGPALTPTEQAFFARTNPLGLILFKRNCETPEQLAELTKSFRLATGRRNALVLVDQEGGRVQRLGPPAWRAYPSARSFGELFARDPLAGLRTARHVGRLMAEDLHAAGINANCIPVLDVPQPGAHDIIGSRAYATTPEAIMVLARAHASGFAEGGILPVIKHIPGHGRATADSHHDLPVVDAKLSELAATDFPPFAAFADSPMAMTAHVVYTAVDPAAPGTLSRKVIGTLIRKKIGFSGLLMTDDLSMKALSGTYADKTRRALAAGCDVVLHCNGELAELEEVAAAAGRLRSRALTRARSAVRAIRKPLSFDRRMALRDLDALLGV